VVKGKIRNCLHFLYFDMCFVLAFTPIPTELALPLRFSIKRLHISLVPLLFLLRLSTLFYFSATYKLQKHKLGLHDCVFSSFSSYFLSVMAKYSLLIVLL
jgi:hypothetical protein